MTPFRQWLRPLARRLPGPVRDLARHGRAGVPAPGWVRFGSLRRLAPISSAWGRDRGLPIDRHYIEAFLDRHREDVRGRVLEVQNAEYTRRFGGDRVERSDVIHVVEGNPEATIVADLADADHLPGDAFDCIILTQTLQYIYDLPAALRTVHRMLKPGGVLLATVPGTSRSERPTWPWCWMFTTFSARRLVGDRFGADRTRIEAFGNVLVATAFLHGLAARELRPAELDHHDPDYAIVVTIRAMKADA